MGESLRGMRGHGPTHGYGSTGLGPRSKSKSTEHGVGGIQNRMFKFVPYRCYYASNRDYDLG